MTLSSGRRGFRQAVLASVCSLAVLSALPAAGPVRAQEAASAVQDVSLQDVVLNFGGMRLSAPQMTASGTRLSKEDLLAILKADGKEPWAARLARLDAGSLAIPELRIEQTSGGMRQAAIYRDVVARGVHAGRIAELTSAGAAVTVAGAMEGKSANGDGSYGKIRAEDVDLAALARLSTEPGDGKGPWQRLYAAFSVESIAFKDERGTQVSFARLAGRDFSGRQLPTTWNGAFDAFKGLDLMQADPAARAKAAGNAANLIEAVSVGSLEATGLRVQETKADTPIDLTIDRLAYASTGADAGISLSGIGFTGTGSRSTISKLSLSGFSLEPTLATLRQLSKPGAAAVVSDADMRRLTPVIGTLLLSGLSLDLPSDAAPGRKAPSPADPLAKPSNGTLHVGLRDASMTFGPPKDGVPVASRLSLSGLTMPASVVSGFPVLGSLGLYGYRDLDLNIVADSAWDESAKELALREVSVSGKDMGTLHLNATLGGIGPEIFDPDAATSGFAMLSATAKTLDLKVQNGGLYDRFIDATSKSLSLKPDELRKEYVTACLIGIPVILGNSPAAKAIGAAMGKFAAKPGTLSISARAKGDAGLGVVDFSTATSPAAVLDKLDVSASAE
ncbi:hypothetical protein [Methylobacterium gnaphalii]|uniref:AsmA-like C-terminal domain-containing protein n=1 Tax=Methylobacterium gnaphalii TaxID=1010610 RepID=A0A512JKF8_9HYPH|nr:hypothetical protein [Methylobacterium gnaphalii]GEP10446.1 hypothetical protein MGN01_22910 [Methylobacterium gnaphalii]GJD70128.1 hypothetical protein MMMDOFMJ_3070 [Methylobacterium gnaphalii]GLS47783.1 hypothetical protein GCM10007885_06270 [Methylobacterium gnaphalii]